MKIVHVCPSSGMDCLILLHRLVTELLRPNKTDVLPYLNGSSNILPPRWARVTVDQRAAPIMTIQEYMVFFCLRRLQIIHMRLNHL